MSKVALGVALLAAGLAGWNLVERESVRSELERVDEAQQALDARLADAERALAGLRAPGAAAEPLLEAPAVAAGGEAGAAAARGAGTATGPGLVATPRAPATVEQRLAQLERALADNRVDPPEASAHPVQALSMPGFLTSIDQAEKQLKLDAAQKAGLERVIEEVERDLEALATRPNEEGKTLKQLQAGLEMDGAMGDEAMAKFHEHMASLSRFRNSKVPGTSETYAEAERRIRKEGKARARSYLSPEQAKSWDRSHTDPLFRGGQGGAAMVFSTVDVAPAAIHVSVGEDR